VVKEERLFTVVAAQFPGSMIQQKKMRSVAALNINTTGRSCSPEQKFVQQNLINRREIFANVDLKYDTGNFTKIY
jgi:hypothetical protein